MAVFGYNTIGAAGFDTISSNVVWVKATTAPASNGTLSSISVYAKTSSGTATLTIAIYADSSGAPGARLAFESTGQTVTTTAGWITVPLSVALTAGTTYWFALADSSISLIQVAFDSSGGATELYFQPIAPFPNPMSGASSDNTERWSTYGTYTPSGASGGFLYRNYWWGNY